MTGERILPLLATDSDWDLLGDRLRVLLRELEDQHVARVLLALEGALALTDDPKQELEAQSLAAYVLGATQRAWDQQRRPLPVFLLEAWYALNDKAAEGVDPPRLDVTWGELHPGSLLLERPDRAELARTDEWLALAQMLTEHDPATLEALGFFERDRDLLERLIVTLTRAGAADDEPRPLSESVLARIENLVPDLARGAHSAIEIGRLAEGLGRKRWWVPEDIPAPPSDEPITASRSDFKPEDVDRVFRDL